MNLIFYKLIISLINAWRANFLSTVTQEGPCDARGNVNIDNDFRSRPLKCVLE